MPPKTKPDDSGYQKLKKDLSDKTLGQLYVFHGEETYLRDYYLGRLREQLLAGGMGTFNLHEIAAKDMSPQAGGSCRLPANDGGADAGSGSGL